MNAVFVFGGRGADRRFWLSSLQATFTRKERSAVGSTVLSPAASVHAESSETPDLHEQVFGLKWIKYDLMFKSVLHALFSQARVINIDSVFSVMLELALNWDRCAVLGKKQGCQLISVIGQWEQW